ncbi:MAG: Tm-1-like ATP-binding domain-containing protein [Boseongicola sp.]
MAEVWIAGTFDTKAAELGFLKECLGQQQQDLRLIDVSTQSHSQNTDISARDVAVMHPSGPGAVFDAPDRGTAVAAMEKAFAAYCTKRSDDIEGVIGAGGGGGTSIITAGMRALPYGVPKVMISTLASGDVAPYVDISDIVMFPSVTDIAGLNRISRRVLRSAAGAFAGMLTVPRANEAGEKSTVGLTMFGVTTTAVMATVEALEPDLECIVFHATGTGGRCMERLVREGVLDGLLDITLTEIADLLVGGVLPANDDRLDVVAKTEIPWVGSVGALDMVNFWAPDTAPAKFNDRLFHRHNSNVTLMRTSVEENQMIGEWIGRKLNQCGGPVRLVLPELGLSALDIKDGPFWSPEANAALFEVIFGTVSVNDDRQIISLPHHINDPQFAAAIAETYREISRS